MTPRRGRSRKGTRCLGQAPYGHWKTTTFVCALRTSGLVAPCVLDGPINGTAFCAWVQQALVRVLQPGDLVIMDNLGSHKVAGIAAAIEAVGPRYATCRLTALTTIRLNKSLPSSRPCSEKPLPEPGMPFGLPVAPCLINSRPPNVNATLATPVMLSQGETTLVVVC
jgi:hypothetical protein